MLFSKIHDDNAPLWCSAGAKPIRKLVTNLSSFGFCKRLCFPYWIRNVQYICAKVNNVDSLNPTMAFISVNLLQIVRNAIDVAGMTLLAIIVMMTGMHMYLYGI